MFLSILIHELGHALAMRSYGFSPSIVLYGMGGLTSFGPGGTSRRGPGAWGHVLISAAGPGAGFLLAAAIVAALRLSGHQVLVLPGLPMGVMVLLRDEVGSPLLTDFINQVLWVSVAWGIVNLLPVFPLDGGQIARELLVRYNPWDGIRQSLVLSFITALILVAVGLAYYDLFIAILFGYLAYSSYAMLRGYGGRRF